MNLWLRGSVLTNPYYRTAFRVARVPREVVRHRTVVELIGRTRQLVNSGATAHTINGQAVRNTEINGAEQILLDPIQRVLAELLEHATEKPPLDRVRKLARAVARAMEPAKEQPVSSPNWKALELMAPDLIREFLNAVPSPDPSFGAMELETPPPFGRLIEE